MLELSCLERWIIYTIDLTMRVMEGKRDKRKGVGNKLLTITPRIEWVASRSGLF
jgi:hypothetical protein